MWKSEQTSQHGTQNVKTHNRTTQKSKKMSNTDPTKKPRVNLLGLETTSSFTTKFGHQNITEKLPVAENQMSLSKHSINKFSCVCTFTIISSEIKLPFNNILQGFTKMSEFK